MAIMNVSDTKIPQIASTGLYNELCFDVSFEHITKLIDVMVVGVTEALSDIKSKDYPVAFVFKEPNDTFIGAAIVQYVPNEDESKPGSWNYAWTFYEDDLPEGTRQVTAYDPQYISYFRAYGHTKWRMIFEDVNYVGDLCRYILSVIKKWLDDNASEVEETGVKLDGVITFRVVVENGEKVFAAEPDGEIKQMIKDDAAIEV